MTLTLMIVRLTGIGALPTNIAFEVDPTNNKTLNTMTDLIIHSPQSTTGKTVSIHPQA